MNQLDALALMVKSLELAQTNPVTTKHSDERPTPGVVIEEWTAEPRNYTGNRLYAGPVTDAVTGDTTGREYHKYWHGLIDLAILTTDEVAGHNILSALSSHFVTYENNPRAWSSDCHTLIFGPADPKSLQFSPPEPTHTIAATIEIEYLDHTQKTLLETGESVLETFENTYTTQ